MKLDDACRLTVAIVALTAFTICVLGTVAIPLVLAYFFSWYWILLYAAYLIIAVCICASYLGAESSHRSNHK